MNKIDALKSVLLTIAATQNQNFDAQLLEGQLEEVFANNGFTTDSNVPDWLVTFFEALLNGTVMHRTPYSHDRAVQGDIANFLAELEDVIEMQWEDEGERVQITADKLFTFGVISIEDDTYQVGLLKSVYQGAASA